jgi:hypothetical protein
MDVHGGGRSRGRVRLAAVVAACACLTSAGCVGPKAVRYTRMRYNEVYRATNDEQLLMNIVRLRYADSPVFIDLPSITSQFEVAGLGNYMGGVGNQFAGTTNLGFGQVSTRDTPTLSYHPREGREIARALLNPLSAELFSVVNAGANIEQLLLLTLNDMNDVPNAYRATTMVPRVPDDNALFRRGLAVLARLQQRDGIELAMTTTDEVENASDPIPPGSVQGRDLLNAAKEGYAYRAEENDQVILVKREREMILRVRPGFIHSAEMDELARIFRLTPGLGQYKIKSELAEDARHAFPEAMGHDTILMNMRSVLQIMVFLSKGVCVPEEHVLSGKAPVTPGPDGRPYDWTRLTSGAFFVSATKHRPRESEVAVKYRGYWFSIAPNDVNSRAVLAILEILFALQDSEIKPTGPVLTLPVGG